MTCSSAADDSTRSLSQSMNSVGVMRQTEEGEDLLEVRGKGWGRGRGGQCTGIHILMKFGSENVCPHWCMKNSYDWRTFICVLMIF